MTARQVTGYRGAQYSPRRRAERTSALYIKRRRRHNSLHHDLYAASYAAGLGNVSPPVPTATGGTPTRQGERTGLNISLCQRNHDGGVANLGRVHQPL